MIPRYPGLLQINTRTWLRRLSHEAGRQISLVDISDSTIDGFARHGFDWIWLLGVWQLGAAGRAVSRSTTPWQDEFKAALPDLTEDDICGSGFAITAYTMSEVLGGERALAQFRARLAERGIRLMLDFVPNHTAIDHPWACEHPEYYVQASEAALSSAVQNYIAIETDAGFKIVAHGRDPNYSGWPDTLQLNYANPALQVAQLGELTSIAEKCDGVRCDMAMLLLPEVFRRTWGMTAEPFWPIAIAAVRARHPEFCFMAEAYWDLEWTLQQQGFDYCYDKRLYDRIRAGDVQQIRDHLHAGLDYQDRLARFLENHDEPRAAAAFSWPKHQAAAVATFLSPCLRFFHAGQLEGARVRVPTHLCREPMEPANLEVAAFYAKLLRLLKEEKIFHDGRWSQIEPRSAWTGNETAGGFIAYAWTGEAGRHCIVVVNYAPNRGQCRLPLPFPEYRSERVRLTDGMGSEIYDRDGSELLEPGLFIDANPWCFNVFRTEVRKR